MKKLVIATLMTSTFISIPALADNVQATESHEMMKNAPMRQLPVFEKLNLTNAQNAKMKVIQDTRRSEERMALKTQWETRRQLICAENFNEEVAKSLIMSRKAMNEKIDIAELKAENSMYNILTPEQKKQWGTLVEEIRQDDSVL